jgi:hypothetical protein
MTESFIPGSDNTEQSPEEQLPEDSSETNEPTDEEIGDGEESVEISGQEATDLNEILSFFHSVLQTHELAINALAAAVFGGPNESQLSQSGSVDSADGDSKVDGEVIPVDFGNSDTSDAS